MTSYQIHYLQTLLIGGSTIWLHNTIALDREVFALLVDRLITDMGKSSEIITDVYELATPYAINKVGRRVMLQASNESLP